MRWLAAPTTTNWRFAAPSSHAGEPLQSPSATQISAEWRPFSRHRKAMPNRRAVGRGSPVLLLVRVDPGNPVLLPIHCQMTRRTLLRRLSAPKTLFPCRYGVRRHSSRRSCWQGRNPVLSEDPDPNYANLASVCGAHFLLRVTRRPAWYWHWNLRGGVCCWSSDRKTARTGQIVIAYIPVVRTGRAPNSNSERSVPTRPRTPLTRRFL